MNTGSPPSPNRASSASHPLRNERGAVLALVVMMLIVLLGIAAFAIDLGIMFVARGEAQRSADAAAHAGAVHLSRAPADDPGARAAAVAVAAQNSVRGQPAVVDPNLDVDVLLDSAKVRVRVFRTTERNGAIPTLFARVIGLNQVGISTVAAAEVWTSADADCVLPVAMPDRFCTSWNGTTCAAYSDGTDAFEGPSAGHRYQPWIQNPNASEDDWTFNNDYTGYTNADRGTVLTLRPPVGSGGGGGPGGGGGGGGGAFGITAWWSSFVYHSDPAGGPTPLISSRVTGCGPRTGLGDGLYAAPGGAMPIISAFLSLIAEDPSAIWNEGANEGLGCVTSSGSMECRDSPRIRPIVLFDPVLGPDGPAASSTFEVQNLVGVFIEDARGVPAPSSFVRGRFIEYMGATPAVRGAGSGSLLKILRIVE